MPFESLRADEEVGELPLQKRMHERNGSGLACRKKGALGLAAWLGKLLQSGYTGEQMSSDVVDILGTSGPVPLGELALRSAESPTELIATLLELKSEGLVTITGRYSDSLAKLSETEIKDDSDTMVRLTRRAFATGGF